MTELIQEHIGFVGPWANPVALGLIAVGVAAVLWSLRRRGWRLPRRLGVVALGLLLAGAGGAALFLRSGPLRPYVDALHRFHGLVGEVPPDLTFHTVADGRPVRLSELRGEPVVLNLWATWCPPCVAELPELVALEERYRGGGPRVVAVSDQEREDLLRFAKSHPLPTLAGSLEDPHWLETSSFLPFTLILDREGRLRSYHFGARSEEQFAALVEPLRRP